jgi:hypothetical protein
VNTTPDERPAPAGGEVALETRRGALERGTLAPSSAAITA